jgi:hypothetical protein
MEMSIETGRLGFMENGWDTLPAQARGFIISAPTVITPTIPNLNY